MVALLAYFPKVSATVSREVKTQIKGEVTTGYSAPATIAIVEPQPVKANELVITEPGDRISNYKVTWIGSEIYDTDEITYRGKKYRVHSVGDRIDEFYRVIMREKVANVA
jgi:hypothetical protein